jgi:hypothetical protein
MNIPGFTAEATLYQSKDHYHTAVEAAQAIGVIQPAIDFLV